MACSFKRLQWIKSDCLFLGFVLYTLLFLDPPRKAITCSNLFNSRPPLQGSPSFGPQPVSNCTCLRRWGKEFKCIGWGHSVCQAQRPRASDSQFCWSEMTKSWLQLGTPFPPAQQGLQVNLHRKLREGGGLVGLSNSLARRPEEGILSVLMRSCMLGDFPCTIDFNSRPVQG